jgi:endonuclease III-like uncharacterized protein
MMTNKEYYDGLRTTMYEHIPSIVQSLSRRNSIEILKELHSIGTICTQTYEQYLLYLCGKESFNVNQLMDNDKKIRNEIES